MPGGWTNRWRGWWVPLRPSRRDVPEALAWVDEFIAGVRPHVAVRIEDNLLIRMPNQASKLNPAGGRVLHYLLAGGTAAGLAAEIGDDQGRLDDVALFLYEVRRWMADELREDNASRAVRIEPLELHFSALPVLAEVALTDRCNLRCAFCYAGCEAAPSDGADPMTTRQVKRVLGRIRHQARVPSVSFTGGEPTLRRDLPELVRHAAGTLGMRVNLISNGTLITARLAQALAAAGLASAQVSIEAPDAGLHDAITGVAGSFERSAAAVDHLRSAGVTVHANTTLNRRNLGVAVRMAAFSREVLGCDRFSMNMVIPAGSAAGDPSLLVRYAEIGDLILAVKAAAAAAGVEFMWYSPTPLCLFNPIAADLGNKGCSACDGLLSVDARGRVLPCSSCDDPVGSLLDETFQAIWQSARAVHYRNKGLAHPECRTCEHFACCHGACPLYWRSFGFGELATACGFAPRPAAGAFGRPAEAAGQWRPR